MNQNIQSNQPTPSLGEGVRERASKIGINFRTAMERCIAGAQLPDPKDLFGGLWYEGELTALYADTNVGKSILAMQIADAVARQGFKVMYIDLELSDKGVERRSRTEDGKIFPFSDNFYMPTIDFKKIIESGGNPDDNGFDVLDRIEAVGIDSGSNVVIIDNITALCAGLETGEMAVKLVNRLLKMRDDNGWSILFLAHTPKLDPTQPITRDSMAGSKRLISLIDSAFAIGVSRQDETLRYIKQTKVRQAECRYHGNNVLLARIERVDGLLQFVFGETTQESNLLKDRSETADPKVKRAAELYNSGMTHSQVAKELKMSYPGARDLHRRAKAAGLIQEKPSDNQHCDLSDDRTARLQFD